MTRRRWRLGCAAAAFFFLAASAGAEIGVTIVDGDIVVTGLSHDALEAPEKIVRVAVDVDAPPIVGDYNVRGDVLHFRPMFPFDPGREYVVRVELADGSVVTTVSLPAREQEPSTVVSALYPSTDVLPENQLKLYVHFSAPMAGGDGLSYIRLVDARGDEVIDPFLPLGDAFWDRDRLRYTVFFDPGRVKRGILPNEQMGRPLVEGSEYRLEIHASWPDAEGLPLAEPFTKTFIAGPPDEDPVDPSTWAITPPRSGTRDPLVVDFPAPLDRALLTRALAVENIDGAIEISRGETRWSFTPDRPWRAGPHALVALAFLEDLAGNQIGKAFEVDVFERIDAPEEAAETHRLPFVIHD